MCPGNDLFFHLQDTGGFKIKDASAVRQASAGDVLYLKGCAYPGNSGLSLNCQSFRSTAFASHLASTE